MPRWPTSSKAHLKQKEYCQGFASDMSYRNSKPFRETQKLKDMKKIKGVIMLMLIISIAAAQDKVPAKLSVGIYANGSASSLVQGMGMNMNMYNSGYGGMYGSNTTMYNFTSSVGGGVSLTVPLHQHWSFVGNLGYMNRGANYNGINSSDNSRYRFSYLDFWALAQYNNVPKGPVKFIASLGVTESTLLSARNETSVSNQKMMANMNAVDIGMVLGPGMEFNMKKKGAIQIKLLYNYGFMNVFRGSYYENGMRSNNALLSLHVGYIFN